MPKFHETIMGHKFYNTDVPKAIKALETIAESLSILAKSKDSNVLQSESKSPPPPPSGPTPRQ